MWARESSPLPSPYGVLPPSTHTASADEGGNESRGGTEVNYQIDVRPQSTLSPFSPSAPPWNQPPTLRRNRAGLSRRIGNFARFMRHEPDDLFPTARRLSKARSINTTVAIAGKRF